MSKASLASIVRSWELSGMSELEPGAACEELERAAQLLGRPLPEELASLYARCNGGYILEGNLRLYPLTSDELSLVSASDFLREHNWPIPQEVVVFGDNGQGDSFGLWLPEDETERPLVVEIGEIFEEDCMAVVGTSLHGFLLGVTTYYALLLEAPAEALAALGVPERFTRRPAEELDDEEYEAIMRWANPDLPDLPLSAYEARLTAADVRRLSRRYAGGQ